MCSINRISYLGRFAIKDFCENFEIDYPTDATQPLRVVDNYPNAIAALLEFVSDIGNRNINVSTADENSIRGSAFRTKYIKHLYDKHFKTVAYLPPTMIEINDFSGEENVGTKSGTGSTHEDVETNKENSLPK